MSGGGNFLSRWSRLKREDSSAGAVREADRASAGGEGALEVEASADGQRSEELTNDTVEELNLPSIDAITRDTDIRAFLRSQVPADLTRAALRKAWTSDPAIRDFVGIAENQRDFNDPHAMPGFGPLRGADVVRALLARTVGGETLTEVCAELTIPAEEGSRPASETLDAADGSDCERSAATGGIEEHARSGDAPRLT